MGAKKTQLMKGDQYGLLKAAELACELIGDYERERDGAVSLRVECPDDPNWDDIEVTRVGRTDRWQVKRLMRDLPASEASKLLATAAVGDGVRRILGVATFVPIKEGAKVVCDLRDLAELCSAARKPGTDPTLFANRERKKPAFRFVLSSLASGPQESAVHGTLTQLRVEELGLEEALRSRARAHLHDVFTNVDDVVDQVYSWFQNNPDGTIVVDAALLYEQVVDRVAKRDPARPRWIHLSRDAVKTTWGCCGPLARQELVDVAWEAGHARVQLGAPPHAGDAVIAALARLALHRIDGVFIEVDVGDVVRWQEHSAALCGGTLGKTTEQAQLGCEARATAGQHHRPRSETDTAAFAVSLNDAMNARVWSAYVFRVDKHLVEDNLAADLRPKLRTAWKAWHACLEADPGRRASFLGAMLATGEEWERKGFDTAIRLGATVVDELARATVVALAVAAAFEGGLSVELGAQGKVSNLNLGLVQAHVVALLVASHPNDRKPWRLANAAGPMFASEVGIAILGVVEASAADLFDVACEEAVPFHASDAASQNFRHTGSPPPILTANPRFVAALSSGIDALKKHLAEMLGKMNHLRLESLRRALDGAAQNG